jgi:lipid II:glycine glycyltransferase (peptidoglycan interpeptide bridge formation enzyme)
MIKYKNRYLTYGLTYFNEYLLRQKTYPTNLSNMDIIYESQYTKKRVFSQEFYTQLIDLTQDDDKILSSFEKNTQYEINRAKNKDAVVTVTLAKDDRLLFYDFYDKFIQAKGLHPLGIRETDLLIDNDMFTIRAALHNDEKIVFHTYITSNNRARLAHSASLFRDSQDGAYRNLIGRANRLLHWEDMLYFKQKGYLVYDLGGINMDSSNEEAQAINKFKRCFGGSLAKEYNSTVPVSLKGYLYLLYRIITRKTI